MPTFKELGYDVVATNWFGLAAPAGLPAGIIKGQSRHQCRHVTPENQERVRQQGMVPAPMDADTYSAFVAHEALRWKPVILKAGLKME